MGNCLALADFKAGGALSGILNYNKDYMHVHVNGVILRNTKVVNIMNTINTLQ